MPETYSVHLEKEQLVFSAAHFITYGDGICESLHGHNYGVRCQLTGPLDPHSCVIDFIWLREALRETVAGLDHRVLLPLEHPQIRLQQQAREVEVRFQDRRWVFPAADCVLLPVDNTTAERLAQYIGRQLLAQLTAATSPLPHALQVWVDENHGQWGVWSWYSDNNDRSE